MTGDDDGAWILAIDLGNGGPKVAAVSLDGEILATALRPVSVTIEPDGTATQDADEWLEALTAAVSEISSAQPGRALHSVAITGQWGSSVPVGGDGRPVGPVLLWADTRAGRHLKAIVGGRFSVSGFAPRKVLPFLRLTGGAPTPSGADPTGHWQLLSHELADVGARTRYQMEPVDYLAYRLTGVAAATPASMILSWLTDNRPGAEPGYVPALVRRARRSPHTLPPLRPTGSVQGRLLPEVAAEFGVRADVPVMSGLPDFHAAAIGSGAVGPFQTHMAISTTAWLSAPVPFKKTDVFHSIATVPGLDPELPMVINNVETAGAALAWLREQVIAPPDGLLGGGSGIGADGAADESLAPSFEELLDLAATAPAGCEGVIFAPWLAGERSPVEDRHLRATWLNLSLRTDRAALVRSVLEGVAFNARWLFDHYEKFLGREVATVRLLGGGAQSDLWCQIVADVLDRPIERVATPRVAQLRGIALWSRVCLGELSLAEAAANVPVDRVFTPDPQDSLEYARMYDVYRRIYPAVKGLYRTLNASV